MDLEEIDIHRQLYSRIMRVMREQKPYLHHNFDVNTLAALVSSNRSYVSQAINQVSGKNFYTWLADYRNCIIIHAVKNNPNISSSDLCALTGINSKETFSRQFKKLNGITFSEFKKSSQCSIFMKNI